MTNYLKAILGALIAGLGSLYQALDNETVTAQEWVAVAIATLAALGVVWGVPNLPAVRRSEGGYFRLLNATWPVSVDTATGTAHGPSRDRTLHGKARIRARRRTSTE